MFRVASGGIAFPQVVLQQLQPLPIIFHSGGPSLDPPLSTPPN